MTFKSNFFLACENFLLDERQRASLINIYDLIWAESFPATHQALKLVGNVKILNSGSKSAVEFSAELRDPDNNTLFKITSTPSAVIPQKKEQNVGVVFNIEMIPLPKKGTYTAILKADLQKVAEFAIDVKKIIPAEQ